MLGCFEALVWEPWQREWVCSNCGAEASQQKHVQWFPCRLQSESATGQKAVPQARTSRTANNEARRLFAELFRHSCQQFSEGCKVVQEESGLRLADEKATLLGWPSRLNGAETVPNPKSEALNRSGRLYARVPLSLQKTLYKMFMSQTMMP
jgi:hypothetical protein